MAFWNNISGIAGALFRLGFTGNAIKNHADGIEVTDAIGTSTLNAVVANATQNTHAATLLNVKQKVILIEFSFTGGAGPFGSSGQYGVCHTAGGGYAVGDIALNTGGVMSTITMYKSSVIMTTAAVVGTLSLIANGVYICTGVGPNVWALKGDGTNAGQEKVIELAFDETAGDTTSTTTIPATSRITRVEVDADDVFDTGATVTAIIDGATTDTTILVAGDSNLEEIGQYQTFQQALNCAEIGPVVVTRAGGTGTAATGKVRVYFVEAFLG